MYDYAILPDGTVTVLGIQLSGDAVSIPEEIEGLPVTQVGVDCITGACTCIIEDASERDKGIVKQECNTVELVIPDSVTVIGVNALVHFNHLKKITLSDNLKRIGCGAFSSSTAKLLKKLPDSVEEIGEGFTLISRYMFQGAEALSKVSTPSSLTAIEEYSFADCRKLTTVTFAKDSQLSAIKNNAFSNCALKAITIPEGVSEIGREAFYGNEKLSKVTLPESIQFVDEFAFSSCSDKLTFQVVSGSYAEQWAADNGFKTKVIKKK